MTAPVHEPAIVGVTIVDNAFDPDPATAAVGDTVTWTNADDIPHDVRGAGGPPGLESPMLDTGQAWSYLASEPGTFTYVCTIHESMVSTLTVVEHEEEVVIVDEAPTTTTTVAPASVVVAPVSAAPAAVAAVPVPVVAVDDGPVFHVELGFLGAVLLTFAVVAVVLGRLSPRG